MTGSSVTFQKATKDPASTQASKKTVTGKSQQARMSVFDRLGSSTHPTTIQRTIIQDTQPFAGSGRGGQNRPNVSHWRKSKGAAHAPAAGRRWWVTGGGSPGGFCPPVAKLAGPPALSRKGWVCTFYNDPNSPITASRSAPGTAVRISSRPWRPCCPREP